MPNINVFFKIDIKLPTKKSLIKQGISWLVILCHSTGNLVTEVISDSKFA